MSNPPADPHTVTAPPVDLPTVSGEPLRDASTVAPAESFLAWMMGGAPPTSPTPAAAEQIPGYEILGELGRGGMGVVYQARQVGLNRAVALKMVLGASRGTEVARFLVEAEAVAAVKHPNVVQVHEYGEHEGKPFLAMEYLDGGSLAGRLAAAGRLDPRAAAELVGKLAAGVQAAHDAGVVHRDLKPGNVLLDATGEPKVTDFGLAKRTGGADLTHTQAVMGTPAYMAPEQAQGNAKFAGPAADVYSLGVILYECLTGGVPFAGVDTWAVVRQVIEREPDTPRSRAPSVPRDLELICLKCLAKNARDRYPTAAALADDLARFCNHEPVSVRAASLGERAAKWASRNPMTARMVGLSALAMVVILGIGLWSRWEVRAAAERETLADTRAALADEQTRRANAERAASERASADRECMALMINARYQRVDARRGWTRRAADELRRAARLPHAPDLADTIRTELAAALTAPDAREVVVWDLPGPPPADDGHHIAAHPQRPLLAVTRFSFPGGLEGWPKLTVWLLDTATGELAHTLQAPVGNPLEKPGGYKESPAGLAFSPDGRWLVMSARSGRLYRWDLSGATPRAAAIWDGKGHGGAVAFGPDGRHLYTRNGSWLRVWDTTTWKAATPHPGRDLGANARTIVPVPAAESLAVSVQDQLLFLDWHDLSDLCPPLRLTGLTDVSVAPDGQTALAAEGGQVAVLDLLSRSRTGTLDYRPVTGSGSPSPSISPDGRFAVITPSTARGLVLHDLASGRKVCDLTVP